MQNAMTARNSNDWSPIPCPPDCHDLYRRGHHTSGVYQIRPNGMLQLDNVYCEMLNHTGWTLLSRRQVAVLADYTTVIVILYMLQYMESNHIVPKYIVLL